MITLVSKGLPEGISKMWGSTRGMSSVLDVLGVWDADFFREHAWAYEHPMGVPVRVDESVERSVTDAYYVYACLDEVLE